MGDIFAGKNVALELFGYLGTILVLTSFLMRNIKWLRVVNIAGSFISFTYALLMSTLPVAVLNGSLILINGIQLMRIIRSEREMAKEVNSEGPIAYDIEEKEKEDD